MTFKTTAALLALTSLIGCKPPDSKAHFDVDSAVQPNMGAVDGLNPDDPPRATGTLVSEHGIQADFVLDEVMVVAPSTDAIQPLLDRWNGTIVGTLQLETDGMVSALVRLDPSTAEVGKLSRNLARTNPSASGDYLVDADRSLQLLALVADEARTWGASVSPNWVLEPHAIADGSTDEAPSGPGGYDSDAFNWTYMQDGGNQDMGVTAAWQILEQADRLDERVSMMIVDGGFQRSNDMPDTRNIHDGSWDAASSLTCGGNPCPWHGTMSMLAAMAEPDNGFGVAGPAGPVAELVAVPWGGGMWGTIARMDEAIEIYDPRVVNLSLGTTIPLDFVEFGPGFLPVLDPRAAPFFDNATENGTLFVASAGNSGVDVNADDATAYTIPCQISTVICVGGLQNDSDQIHGGSNFGSVDNGDSVEIFGPFQVWSHNDVSDPSDNSTRTITGTSFASPHVAGIAALVIAANDSLTNWDVRSILNDTAQSPGWATTGSDRRVDAEAAIIRALDLPEVEITDPRDGYSVPVDTEIVFEATARNASGDSFQLVWDLAGDTEVTNEGGLGDHVLFYDELPPGTHTITASATSGGVTISDSIEVVIEYDGFDLAVLTPANGGIAFSGEELQLTGFSSAVCCLLPESDVGWRVIHDGDTIFTDTGHTATMPAHLVDPGTYTVEFQGTDGIEAVTRDILLNVIEKPESYPTATIALPSSGSSWIDPELVEFQGYASDPEDGVVSSNRLKWTAIWSGGTVDLCTGSAWPGGSGNCGFFEYELRDLAGGGTTYTIVMEAMDDDGNVDEDQVGVTIEFAPVP
ncbi:MAG: S8/S53 family peptidase [Myxococcales bacterium]|nr:S8/S53 family peptidase [Myxococcales bacterium]